MKDMKYDKIGAVNGSISLLHMLEMKSLQHINFIGIFPFAENVISENSILPGDVITSLSGKTVEIINPDAEGRLILADAFTYASRYEPDILIDIATLTGHAESINCWHNGYFFAEPEDLKQLFEKRTNDIGERMIPMPTWNEYREVLNSTVADLINDSNVCDDSFTAALFLKEFLPKNCKWLHIDLAHEITGRIANGTGIRSIIDIIDKYIPKKK
jgi:leucyl aminopeptidase